MEESCRCNFCKLEKLEKKDWKVLDADVRDSSCTMLLGWLLLLLLLLCLPLLLLCLQSVVLLLVSSVSMLLRPICSLLVQLLPFLAVGAAAARLCALSDNAADLPTTGTAAPDLFCSATLVSAAAHQSLAGAPLFTAPPLGTTAAAAAAPVRLKKQDRPAHATGLTVINWLQMQADNPCKLRKLYQAALLTVAAYKAAAPQLA